MHFPEDPDKLRYDSGHEQPDHAAGSSQDDHRVNEHHEQTVSEVLVSSPDFSHIGQSFGQRAALFTGRDQTNRNLIENLWVRSDSVRE
jgi:hypothetical protein